MKEPKIRFKGFSGEWKKVKLGGIGSWTKGKLLSKDNISEAGIFKCIHYGELFTMYDEIIYQVFSKTDLNNGCLSQIGDILFPDSDVTPTGLARCSSIMETGVILGGGILILRPLPQYYSPFISLSVNNEKQQIISRITGTTVRHINATSLSEIEIVYTENIAEQQSIASFFTSLDAQISASTSHLVSLKQMKAASLQTMFPQEGETVPKVRFRGFEGEWKKVKLGEIGSWSKGKLLSKDNISKTGKFKCIHYGELFTMYDEIIYQVFSKTDLNNGCLSQIGDILFPDSDVTPTGLARCSSIMETGVILGGGILILRPLPQYYSPFISLSVNNEKQQIISRITGTTVRHINATSLGEIEIVCTENIAEQQSIASFFTSLDRQIALHAKRLEKLKQIKAACLDKMFV